MTHGVGIDMIEVERVGSGISKESGFREMIFSATEIAYCESKKNKFEHYAARFAAKEAGAKALGTGISHGVSWLEIEVVREPSGRPTIKFYGRAAQIAARLGVTHATLSITHTTDLAMASVVLENGA